MNIKGILTNCVTNEEREVELEYVISLRNGERIFSLLNGVTGWESFHIDNQYTNLNDMKESGWLACIGTPRKYDKLFVPAEEMQKALKKIEQTPKSTLIIEKQRQLKNLKDQRDAKQRDINNLNIEIEKIERELSIKTETYKCGHLVREVIIDTTPESLVIYSEWKASDSGLCIECWLVKEGNK